MASRPVKTSELGHKYQMNAVTVKTVLKQAKIKPLSLVKTPTGREWAEWPNREANAALRTYRETKPARGPGSKTVAKKSGKEVANIAPVRMAKQIEHLTQEIADLRKMFAVAMPGISKIVKDLGG